MNVWLIVLALLLTGCNGENPAGEDQKNNTDVNEQENDGSSDAGVSDIQDEGSDSGTLTDDSSAADAGVLQDAGVFEEEPTFGEPPAELVGLEHATVIEVLERNITHHMDELDTALNMVDGSQSIENLLALLPLKEDEEEEEEGFQVDLADLRDGSIDILKDRLIVESTATQSDDGKTVTYTVSPELLCEEEPEDNESDEKLAERLENIAACEERAENRPITIHATSPGADRIDLAIAIGTQPSEGLRLQIYDDMMAAFVSLSSVRSLVKVFVSPDDFELPTRMIGEFAMDVRRESEAHFLVRAGILTDIRVSSPFEADTARIELDRDLEPGQIRINGPQELIDGEVDINAVLVIFGWQKVVDIFHDDEDTVENVCTNNHADADNCEQYEDTCLPSCIEPENEMECRAACEAALYGHIREALQALNNCIAAVPETDCGVEDYGCRSSHCEPQNEAVSEVCDRQESCEEVRTPAPESPDVEGVLTIHVPGASGELEYAGADDTFRLNGLALGDETLTIDVNGDTLIGLDVNPENGRQFDLTLNGLPNDGFQAQVSPVLDVRVMFAVHHVEDVIDLPDFMSDETMTIKLDNADKPTLKLIKNDNEDEIQACRDYHDTCNPACDAIPDPTEMNTCRETCTNELPEHVRNAMDALDTCRDAVPETECSLEDAGCREDQCPTENDALKALCEHEESITMEVVTGRLTLSSTAMDNDVVINEGMCMGNDENLTEEEQDALHDLFGGKMEAVCED